MKILLIDRKKRDIHLLSNCLRRAGYVVDCVCDGKKGLYCASIYEYDLIIMNITLPEIGGKEICETLREDGRNCPIVILSTITDVDIKIKMFNLGVDDYVEKPFSSSELVARVNAILRRPRVLVEVVQTVNEYIVNLSKRTVFLGSKEIKLTRKEFTLLSSLIANKNEVVSRGYIIEHVWDINADPFSNTIETHIRNLRIKFGDLEKKEVIVTIPGIGYKICCK